MSKIPKIKIPKIRCSRCLGTGLMNPEFTSSIPKVMCSSCKGCGWLYYGFDYTYHPLEVQE